jgi:hypothetical protein
MRVGSGLVESFAILQKSKGSKAERKLKKEGIQQSSGKLKVMLLMVKQILFIHPFHLTFNGKRGDFSAPRKTRVKGAY